MSRIDAARSIFVGGLRMMWIGMTQETHVSPRSRKRRAAEIAAQVALILLTAGLIVAIWLPAIVGPSKEKPRRDAPPARRSTR